MPSDGCGGRGVGWGGSETGEGTEGREQGGREGVSACEREGVVLGGKEGENV